MQQAADIPLSILVVDTNHVTAKALSEEVKQDRRVIRIKTASSISEAQRELQVGGYNTIFVDPLSIGLNEASDFVFSVRRALPEIVFGLFVDSKQVDNRRREFYSGERHRFEHYYTLDKRTPFAAFSDEVSAMLARCIGDLRWRMSTETLKKIRSAISGESGDEPPSPLTADLSAELDKAISLVTPKAPEPAPRPTVFLSHRFAETEYVNGLTQLLEGHGFAVVIGNSMNTYVSQGVLQRISEADYFICLMTRDKKKDDGNYTTSAWLLEEKGAALALKKRIVLLVEHGVDEYGGLQGDWQMIHFNPKGFTSAAFQAVKQLQSYAGS